MDGWMDGIGISTTIHQAPRLNTYKIRELDVWQRVQKREWSVRYDDDDSETMKAFSHSRATPAAAEAAGGRGR